MLSSSSSSLARLLATSRVMTSSAKRMTSHKASQTPPLEGRREKLFTPGPLSVSDRVRLAGTRDIGTRHPEFMQIIREIQSELLRLAGAPSDRYACVPMQGSGTFALESAVMTSLACKDGKILIAENGAYGRRLAELARHTGTPCHVVSVPEGDVIGAAHVTPHVTDDVTAVCCVHCETSTGVVNDVEAVGRAVKRLNPEVTYLVDAMSSFGALPLCMGDHVIDLMVSSANKCLQGIPGFSYVIADVAKLDRCEGRCASVCLDLFAQRRHLQATGQFRFTAPTHSMLAFREALRELDEEGGVAARFKRYKLNSEILHRGMTDIGFEPFLDPRHHPYSCVITSFRFPSHPNFRFPTFYRKLSDLGDVIYPGQVSAAECFRIGTIGDVSADDVTRLVDNVRKVTLEEMRVEFG